MKFTGLRWRFLAGSTALLTLGLGCGRESDSRPASTDGQQRNAILISLDTLRHDRLGCYGCPSPVSPFLDAFSRHAVVFSDPLAQTPSTVTSHRAIFTSRYLYAHDAGHPLPGETLAGTFQSAGWETAAFVDGGLMNHIYGNAAGFEQYDDRGGGLEAVCSRAREWLRPGVKPGFFLFLHTYDIHCPYTPPGQFGKMFVPDIPFRFETEGKCGRSYFNSLNLNADDYRYIRGLYDGGVRYCDSVLEKFFVYLADSGILDDTVVVVFSDHGESLGEKSYIGHRQLFDVQLKVPLLIRSPGAPGSLETGPVETLDIMPTLLDLFGLKPVRELQGETLVAAPDRYKAPASGRIRINENHSETGRAVRDDSGWKLIIRSRPEQDELYWPGDDPEERSNVIGAHPEQAARLRELYMASTGQTESDLRERFQTRIIQVPLMGQGFEKPDEILHEQLKTLGYLQ